MSQPSTSSSSETKKNYKDTLNLPVTDFKMKAGAATREPEIEAMWDERQVYQQSVERRKKQQAPKFVLHDGPPYLSSDKIHIGTALNKILKDIVTRYKYQRGYFSPYIPGYDSHGLPIENAVAKDIKGGRHAVSEAELRRQCRVFALKNLDGQETNFKRLGVWGDWRNPYITMDAHFEATQIKLFYDMYQKGYVYKGLKPVYWSPTSESALAEAEVEYADHTSHSIYVAFKFTPHPASGHLLPQGEKEQEALVTKLADAAFVIWTTTPWTLPANLALSIHPNFDYVVVETDKFGKLIVAQGLLEQFSRHVGIENPKVLATFKGADLELLKAQHPFIASRQVPVLLGDHVTLEAGTGIVHTAPGHGMEDYQVCQKYDRERQLEIGILSPLDNKGKFDFSSDDDLPEGEKKFTPEIKNRLSGKFYEDANLEILEILKENNTLLGHSTFVHSYPHDWRTHKPVIYRATEQWFISIDKIRQTALDEIKHVGWIPERGESRITSMVEGRSDWCISRQRVWGVPIPIFYYEDTDEAFISQEIIDHLYELFKEHTSDIWWAKSADELLSGLSGDLKKQLGVGVRPIRKEMDIMDVWFDSGVTHTAVVEARKSEFVSAETSGEYGQAALPVEMYLEGSDQHRGWFQSSLLTSVMSNGKAPYKTVLTHGFVLDQEGRKMSKSLGNVVDPNKVMNQYGADILRLWVASVDYTQDIRIGDQILAQLAETYKKVRNTFRFMLGNLADFNPEKDTLETHQLSRLDRFVLYRLNGLIERVTADFDHYEFHRYNHEIQYFCGNDLSAQYFDITKDILYCDKADAPRRRAVQTVIYKALLTLLPMLVPIMPHLAEDIWENLPKALKPSTDGEVFDSVTLLDWPEALTLEGHTAIADEMQALFAFRTEAMQALECARKDGKIGSALEAKLLVSGTLNPLFDADELATLCLVSQVVLEGTTISSGSSGTEIYGTREFQDADARKVRIDVVAADGQECQRCWKHDPIIVPSSVVPASSEHQVLCQRCTNALTGSK
ncbi:MAG: isoleucine--tRNA ligase [Vampirovibrionales bacterium]|nr:isoleucine--tRNA ligase [Vampirovibrionales bacterium]